MAECAQCTTHLSDDDHVVVDGETLCASEGRIDELNKQNKTYTRVTPEGTTLKNYVSRR